MKDIDLSWNDYPVCPYCGCENHDWWDGHDDKSSEGDSWNAVCPKCDKEYNVIMHVETKFDTSSIDTK